MDPYLLLAAAEGCEPGLVPALLDPREDPVELLRRESGKHFDPQLVELFIAQLPAVLAIKEQYAEQPA